MTPVLLGDLFELKYGKSLRKDNRIEGAVPVFGSNGQVDVHNQSLINHPTIIVGRKGSIGEIHLIKKPCWPIDTTYFVKPLEKHEFDLEWLYRLLGTLRLQELNRSAAIPGLNRDDVYRISVLLPPLNDQIRIAHLLGKVEVLIALRKQHLQQLDDLLKSVFLDIFGKDIRDESSYSAITSACELIDYRGKTPPRVDFGVPLISAKCVRKGYFDASRLDYVTEETYQKIMTRGFPAPNDVLFTTEGATFGYTCRIPQNYKKFSVGQRLITMQCKDGYQPEVLEFVLNDQHIQKKLASRLSGSAALGIRSAELVKVKIPFPDPANQLRFAKIVQKVEALKSRYQQSLNDLESLYGALSQQAFKGELDLSQVSLPDEQIEHNAEGIEAPESVEITIPLSDFFQMPATAINADVQTDKGRKEFFTAMLTAWLEQFGHKGFSLEDFLGNCQNRLWSLTDGESNIGVEDYDIVKGLIFETLESGKLKQERNQVYCVIETKETVLGNLIELKSGEQR